MNVIIVPVLNERNNPVGERLRATLRPWREKVEIVYVDGGSTDGTVQTLRAEGFRVLEARAPSRGLRMQLGLEATVSEMVLFHHPRSILEEKAIEWFSAAGTEAGWGGFTHQFDTHHPLLHFTSWYSNKVRGQRGILYLDHCIFAPRAWLVRLGGVPTCEIFEDTELSKRLLTHQKPSIMPYRSVTSSVRFVRNGYLRQGLLNQWLKLSYYLSANDRQMNQRYEAGLSLNTVHKED